MPTDLTWAWLVLFFEGFLVALFWIFVLQFIFDKITGLFTHIR